MVKEKKVTAKFDLDISKTQVYTENGTWKDIEFKKIKKGDIFRMFNGDSPVIDMFGNDIWQATEKAYYDRKKKTYTADCKPVATASG
jgi:hypothetical protein